MRAAYGLLILVGLMAAAACGKSQNQNIADNNFAGADVETLPPDESVGTPSNELINGADNPDVNTSANTSD